MQICSIEVAKELIYSRFREVIKIGENSFKVPCPFHNSGEEASPSLCISLKLMAYNCFICGAHGRLSDLLGLAYSSGNRLTSGEDKSYFFRSSTAKNSSPKPRGYSRIDYCIDPAILDEFDHGNLQPLLSLGFSADILREHRVCYDPLYNRIVFPVFDIGGNLRNIVGRSYNSFPPYRIYTLDMLRGYAPAGYRPAQKWLFGEDKVTNGELIVVKGFKGCLRLKQFGFNCVALMGVRPTNEQMAKLFVLGREIFVMFDNDEIGNKAGSDLVTRLSKKAKWEGKKCKANLVDFSFTGKHQPDDLTFEEICQALCNAGFNPLHIDANLC
jgi:DNA primase